jgi:hypothetical protein
MGESNPDLEEQPSKRQRLDVDEEDEQAHDDEEVLTLAADGITDSVDAYGTSE